METCCYSQLQEMRGRPQAQSTSDLDYGQNCWCLRALVTGDRWVRWAWLPHFDLWDSWTECLCLSHVRSHQNDCTAKPGVITMSWVWHWLGLNPKTCWTKFNGNGLEFSGTISVSRGIHTHCEISHSDDSVMTSGQGWEKCTKNCMLQIDFLMQDRKVDEQTTNKQQV